MDTERAAPALAVTIENQDENSYKYSIQEGEYHDEGEYHAEDFVGGGETTADPCNACFLVIVGVGGFVVSGPECIVIEDGKATVLPR